MFRGSGFRGLGVQGFRGFGVSARDFKFLEVRLAQGLSLFGLIGLRGYRV